MGHAFAPYVAQLWPPIPLPRSGTPIWLAPYKCPPSVAAGMRWGFGACVVGVVPAATWSLRSRYIRGGVAPPLPPPLGAGLSCGFVIAVTGHLDFGISQPMPAGAFPPPAPLRGVSLPPVAIFPRLGLGRGTPRRPFA